ncbi:orotidine 5'-phosphate decarboxylase / HUMPS family protein [Thermoproteus tenax]|uniref:3-hexulose-6-phosphate synthase n=1 Tax=Thermoproteus tenax (strain ATCC 35583 / DSM 2078 / JCM 9277 / NBRC 100435 / Kra 1) TaxID=768679 RepID=G4RKQ3_THETK|nr:orotidine 5'-phosphate decarboxylase / HUMPS family protein [Thermoproteus tenax]CCC82148.1 3-hexulose-6-phosphate synthase [Thermoproteus tenax Kra 1]
MRIQVALDLVDLLRTIDMARSLCEAGADLLEAGTPLIKTFGLGSVGLIKSACRTAEVVADLKTADVGALEAELAWKAGADWATVMAGTNLETIEDFVNKARELGLKVVVDTIGVADPETRVREIVSHVAVDMVTLHIGIDVQRRRGIPIDRLIEEAERIKRLGVKVALAGGIGQRELEILSKRDIDVVIVGRFITSAPSPKDAFLLLKSIINK